MEQFKRKLASIQVVSEIQPHGNADALELAKILGWQVIVKKGEFKPRDLVIYLEIDSVCPKCEWSLFLEKYGFRVRTIRLRGQLSQGLVLPISILGSVGEGSVEGSLVEGNDVTEKLNITKYEPLEETFVVNDFIKSSPFPTSLGFSKTDEPRIQSMPELLDLFKGKKWYATLKVDGMSGTFFIDPETKELACCSRNNRVYFPLKEDSNIIDEEKVNKSSSMHLKFAMKNTHLVNALSRCPNLVIQGELYGPKIQGNKLGVSELNFAIFSIYDMTKRSYCTVKETIDHCNELGLQMVPIIHAGDHFDFTVYDLLEMAKGKYPGNNKHDREGLVIRLHDEVYNGSGSGSFRASFKVINNDFLEKEK